MNRFVNFCKEWSLPISITVGIVSYLIYHSLSLSADVKCAVRETTDILQPLLIFLMLFITFCDVAPKDMCIKRWHIILFAIQAVLTIVFGMLALYSTGDSRLLYEVAMSCIVCPTATASGVVTKKLGGEISGVLTYIILSNLLVSILIPTFAPLINPYHGLDFWSAFIKIIVKLFPILVGPLFLAWIIRYALPKWHAWVLARTEWAFYIWIILLPLVMAVATKTLIHSHITYAMMGLFVVVSLACCLFQFGVGKWIGHFYGETITAGQALGQKNTASLVWMAYNFMTPVVAVAGGLYAIWHNNLNSYQIHRTTKNKRQ